MEIRQKKMTNFKVTQGQWNRHDRSSTYDFLLVFHGNYTALSLTVSEINDDICQISHPLH